MSRVHHVVSRALRDLGVARHQRVLVAVSGGADSVALVHVLLALDQAVGVGHVHHGLRAEADDDEAFVVNLARTLGAACRVRRVSAATRDGRSPEARARALRYEALESLRGDLDCTHVATAHTCDDQAETVLLRQIRGTGLDGLAGIVPRTDDGRLLRPLLKLRRRELRDYLGERAIAWREDASNLDVAIPRNRLRRDVLPVLEEIHPGATERLASLAELARAARESGRAPVDAVLERASETRPDGIWLDPVPLAALDPTQRTRALAALLVRAGLAGRITRRHLERIAEFLGSAPRGAALSLPGDSALVRRGERFWLGRGEPARRALS